MMKGRKGQSMKPYDVISFEYDVIAIFTHTVCPTAPTSLRPDDPCAYYDHYRLEVARWGHHFL